MSYQNKYSQKVRNLGSGIGKNVFLKNSNLEKLLQQNNLLLENIISASLKEFERFWHPIKLHLTAPASTASLAETIDKEIQFPYSYLIKSIAFFSQTNDLAGFAFQINGIMYPTEGYTITASALTPSIGKLYYHSFTTVREVDFNLFVDKPFNMRLFAMNTHTSDQIIYIMINGYRLPLDQILKIVKKGKVRSE